PHALQLGDRANGVLIVFENSPDQGQILRTDLRLNGNGSKRGVWLSQGDVVLEAPGSLKVIGEVRRLLEIEVQNALDRILFAVGFHQHGKRSEIDTVRREDHMVRHGSGSLQVLIQEGRRHRERLSGVVESGRIGGIDGKLAGRLNVLASEIPN